MKLKLIALTVSLVFISVTFALPGLYTFGTGSIVAECSHGGIGYGFRTANGVCPGIEATQSSNKHLSPLDLDCIERETPMW